MRGSRNFWMLQIGANATDLWPAVGRIALVTGSAASWWTQINDSSQWQDGVFYFLSAAYGLVSAVALIQLIRIELRVPEYGWTTQKVFHLLNFIVNGLRAIIFGFHTQVFSFKPKVFLLILLDLPGLLFFSTYTLLVLFWAEIYHQARSLPTDKLRIIYISINGAVYFIQVCIWIFLWLDDSSVVESIGSVFIAVVSFVAALGFLLYGGRLFMMLRRFPIESKGRRKKLHEANQVDVPPAPLLPHDHLTQSGESDMVLARMRDHDNEFDSKSGSENLEGASGDDNDLDRRPKKKRYHRHTQHQIQEMEAFFKECPHPDDKQRKELSRELGLEPLQVKFWFQNKRTQMKTQHERQENGQLKTENEKLRAENMRYREALGNASCPTCGGPTTLGEMSFDEQHLRIENARLREEIDRISGIAAKYVGKPMLSYTPALLPAPMGRASLDLGVSSYGVQPGMVGDIFGGGELLNKPIMAAPLEIEKPMVIELAVAAMEELIRMSQLGEPLWAHSDGPAEVLSEEEYLRTFPRGIGPRPFGLKSEASRETAVVIMNPSNLVEILMDANQWSSMFFHIISRAVTLEILSTGVAGNWNGALQVMSAEFQMPTPLVPTRESYFVRYCKHHPDGSWAIVDVSLDNIRPNAQPVLRCRRRPSGCVIEEMPNGYSKVTWVEHVEVDDRAVHSIYKSLVNSGLAFGAKRWVATLDRQCERLASAMATNIPQRDVGVITSPEGRRSMLKLAERMVISFCTGVSASTAHTWTTLSGSGAEDVRVMTRKSIGDPGRPPGIVLSTATSFWLPVPPKRVFDFLRDENSRNEWDILSNGGMVQEMAHIANGHHPGNCVSLLRVNSTNSNQSNMLILQESCTDSSGSYVIYAPVDVVAMNSVLSGGDPECVALLPSGFAILPDGPTHQDCEQNMGPAGASAGAGGGSGSLLTVAFQILVDSAPTAKLSLGSVATVNSLIACTVDRIKASVTCDQNA